MTTVQTTTDCLLIVRTFQLTLNDLDLWQLNLVRACLSLTEAADLVLVLFCHT